MNNTSLRLVGKPAEAGQLLGGPVRYFGDGSEAVTELDREDLQAHHRRFGVRAGAASQDGERLIETLTERALTGRGGGHFPVATKWRATRAAGHRTSLTPVVVANGAEGEPLSGKDAALMELRPHLVLDGLTCAAHALGAHDAIVWLHEGAHAARASLMRAIAERRHAAIHEPPIRIVLAPDRYVSGESSAVIRALSGGPALPGFRRTPSAASGVNGRPTLLHNVETLARVAVLAREDFDEPPTLLTIAVPGHRVVTEVAPGTPLADAVGSTMAGARPQAILVGGYGGSWAPWHRVEGVSVSEPALRTVGLSLGAGVLLPLPADACGVEKSAGIAEFLADSSARQCGPCLFGLRAVADALDELADCRARRRDTERLRRFLGEISGRGACHHPDGAVRMVASALATFSTDVAAHLKGRCVHGGGLRNRGRRG